MVFQPQVDVPRVGLFELNGEPVVRDPDAVQEIAVLAEELGYDSLWMGEHPVLPDAPDSGSPFDARYPLNDPLTVLSYVAAVTRRVKLATGILLLPLRNPVILAKQLATLDVLSGGRVIMGFGMGYIPGEAEAVGIGFADRVARGAEHLDALRSLWHDEHPAHHGRFVDFDQVDAQPRPVQSDLHVVAGGHAPGALRRAVTHAHGWYGFGLRPHRVPALLDELRAAAETHERPASLGPLEITVTPPRGPVDRATMEEYAAVGVHRLVLYPGGEAARFGEQPDLDVAGLKDYVHAHAPGSSM